jgi:hypothetical protein
MFVAVADAFLRKRLSCWLSSYVVRQAVQSSIVSGGTPSLSSRVFGLMVPFGSLKTAVPSFSHFSGSAHTDAQTVVFSFHFMDCGKPSAKKTDGQTHFIY